MATPKQAVAGFTPKRQRSQYTCMATSLSMALESCGIEADEDTVNKVMGAAPMQGASWEQAFAASQHFGARVTFICPATLAQVKAYTDKGVAVMIAWNPEGRPWSHASVIKDVDDEGNVTVADPNIPDPDVLTRTMPKAEFYGKWYEKWDSYLVRRPAMAVEREVSPEGRQMVASQKLSKETKVDPARNPYERERGTRNWGAGGHNTRTKDVGDGSSRKDKHKKPWSDKDAVVNPIVARVASRHIEAFQFALAQAFADQVGMPERMTLAQLTKLLGQAFIDLVSELDWQSNDMSLDGMTSVDLSYGPFKDYGWENGPPEQAEGSFDVPAGAAGTYTARVTIKNLALTLMNMRTPTMFFKHKGREILAFLASPKNRVLLERFLISVPLEKAVENAEFSDISYDALSDIFSEAAESGVIGGAGTSAYPGDVEWDFDEHTLTFSVHVTFTYDGLDDLEVEDDGGPDYDDRWD